MYELDCLGDMCPIPIMKLKQCKQIKGKGGQLKLVTDTAVWWNPSPATAKNKNFRFTLKNP